jgi:hypothetical protein
LVSIRTKLQLTGQTAINFLERCMTLTEMAEQRRHDAEVTWFAYLDNEEASWSDAGCPDDYAHAKDFGLTGVDSERFLDWCANQRHYFRLCESGVDGYDASCQAQNDRGLLTGRAEVYFVALSIENGECHETNNFEGWSC